MRKIYGEGGSDGCAGTKSKIVAYYQSYAVSHV